MSAGDYSPPVDELLAIGEPPDWREWPNYAEKFELGSEHVSELIRMATDRELEETDAEQPDCWAPVHARRALGQLRAEAAIEPLLSLLHECEDDEWVAAEMPEVFELIGPAAVPALAAYVADKSRGMYPRVIAAEILARIGQADPETRAECVRAIAAELELFQDNHQELNSFLIGSLIDLKALEWVPLIERAFAAGCVVEDIIGDWEDVQVEMGLKAKRETPRKKRSFARDNVAPIFSAMEGSDRRPKQSRETKAKKKMVKASRRKNRKDLSKI